MAVGVDARLTAGLYRRSWHLRHWADVHRFKKKCSRKFGNNSVKSWPIYEMVTLLK